MSSESEATPSADHVRWPRVHSPIALYPAALAFALIIELLNTAGVSPFSATRSLVAAVVIALVLSWIGRLVLRDADRGGVLAGLWILGLLGADDLRLAAVIGVASAALLAERYLLPVSRRTIRWVRVGWVFERLAVILVIAVGIQGVQLGTMTDALRSAIHETALRPSLPAPTNPADPDIYMVLLDGHTRADILSSMFGRDESAFVDALTADGFTVAPKSRSNYTLTPETLSSMFNAEHLADIERMQRLLAGTESRPVGAIVRGVINDNATFSFLRSRGYEIDAISSGYEQEAMREADRFVDTGQINEFEFNVIRRSVLNHVLQVFSPDLLSSQQRSRIQGVFDELAAAPTWAGDRPRFVFAHVPSPHAPWVFTADGSPRTVADIQNFYVETTQADAYADQVVDNDRRLLTALGTLDDAIAARGRPAVIVIFSDHGSWVYAEGGDIRLRFKNLVAVRATDRQLSLESNVTLVNLLPDLFEQLFGVPWVRQPDTQYRFGTRDPFQLVEVQDPDALGSP